MFALSPQPSPRLDRQIRLIRQFPIATLALALLLGCIAIGTGCIGTSVGPLKPTSQIGVTIVPASGTVESGGWLQFSALVTGTNQTSVTWTTTAGSISGNGMLHAPGTLSATHLTVTASSTADAAQQASAIVNVTTIASLLTITTTTLAPSQVSILYNTGLSASGGQAPYSWRILSGSLPKGILLSSGSGMLSGAATAAGTFAFAAEVVDANGNTANQGLSLVVTPNSAVTACALPSYPCARTDTSVIPLGNLPAWGGLTGANKIFYDPGFNSAYPPEYVRVTDASTGSVLGLPGSGFAVSAGSGDDAHFNADDSLFTVTGQFAYWYVFGLDQTTMQTGLVYASSNVANVIWSQTNPNYFYSVGNNGVLERYDFSDTAHCRLGGSDCAPTVTTIYDFISTCTEPSGARLWVNAGIGGGDRWFAAASGQQDTDNRVFAYDSETQTCYFYNTRFGTVHAYDASNQTVITSTLSCDGQTGNVLGANFDPNANWRGLNIVLTPIGGTTKATYQVLHVSDATHMQLGYTCSPAGTYNYSLKPGTYVGAVSAAENYSVHNIRMDPGGKWLIVEEGSNCYDATGAISSGTNCNVIHAWQLGSATVNSCPWVAGYSDTTGACSGHYTESARGWINDAEFGNSTNPSMQYRDWSNLSTTASGYGPEVNQMNSGNVDLSGLSFFGDHPTNKNDPLGTHDYPVFSSTYSGEPNVGAITAPYSNEIIGWNQGGGAILRFGHTFNSALEPHSQFSAWIAVGSVSSTGKFYLFTTDGEGTLGNIDGSSTCSIVSGNCRSDVFLLNLIPAPAN